MAAALFAPPLGRGRGAGPLQRSYRLVLAWVAAFGLCLQLAATSVCPAGPSSAVIGFGQTIAPICHNESDGPQADGGHHGPGHQQHDCPLCSLHCHGAVAAAPDGGVGAPLSRITAQAAEPAPFAPRPLSRFVIGASPRGPPTAG